MMVLYPRESVELLQPTVLWSLWETSKKICLKEFAVLFRCILVLLAWFLNVNVRLLSDVQLVH